jgi:hypothetical protein
VKTVEEIILQSAEDEDDVVKTLDFNELVSRFAYAGRAFDCDLNTAQRAGMMRLENKKIVKLKHFETSIRLEKKDKNNRKKTENKPYTVFYWEPTVNIPEAAVKEEEEYKCYGDESVWDRSNGSRA